SIAPASVGSSAGCCKEMLRLRRKMVVSAGSHDRLRTAMAHWTETTDNRAFAAEIKFLIPRSIAGAVRDWARTRLGPDPHGEGPARDLYWTGSLYFDTARLD